MREKGGKLSVSLEQVHHGGGLAMLSKAGGGTVFEVYFPADTQEFTSDVRQERPETRGTTRILLVDDEEALTDLGRQMLEAAGYSVVVETDSTQALELFRRDVSGIDLIITDMNMPQLDGLRLMKRCREIAPTIPVILYTGCSDLVVRERVLEEGGSEFLLKPVTRHELVECVERVLGGAVGS